MKRALKTKRRMMKRRMTRMPTRREKAQKRKSPTQRH
jgi:hypothetical protein